MDALISGLKNGKTTFFGLVVLAGGIAYLVMKAVQGTLSPNDILTIATMAATGGGLVMAKDASTGSQPSDPPTPTRARAEAAATAALVVFAVISLAVVGCTQIKSTLGSFTSAPTVADPTGQIARDVYDGATAICLAGALVPQVQSIVGPLTLALEAVRALQTPMQVSAQLNTWIWSGSPAQRSIAILLLAASKRLPASIRDAEWWDLIAQADNGCLTALGVPVPTPAGPKSAALIIPRVIFDGSGHA